ncbi:MAG TPA: toxic anion resistance protein [Candidatus Xenobia bacterium]|jgi:uncharacterized protein YaaN involved in tellurite resistance
MTNMNGIGGQAPPVAAARAQQPAPFVLFETRDEVRTAPAPDPGIYQLMTAPAAPQAVAQDSAVEQAREWVRGLVKLPVDSADFERRLNDFRSLGRQETDEFMRVSQRVLGQAMTDHGKSASESKVGDKLVALRQELEKIDPSNAFGKLHGVPLIGKWFGANKVRPEYMKDFESAHSRIESITMELYGGQDGLRRDCILLEQQRGHVHGLTEKLSVASTIAEAADQEMVRQIGDIASTDPSRADALQKNGLFYIRQKAQDLATQVAVNAQAELVYGILRENNKQLVKEVDRTTQTAVAALQVGVTAQVAVNHQKEVLDKTRAINKAVENVVTHTAARLQSDVANLQDANFDPDALRVKLQAVYACLDEADQRKADSLQKLDTALQDLQTTSQPAPKT